MRVLIKKTDNLTVPARANKDDLGYDIIAASEPKIIGELSPISKFDGEKNILYYKSIDYIEYETNLFISPQKAINWRGVERKFHSLIFSRSSISKYWLSLANNVAIIDNGYTGQIKLRYRYLFQPSDLIQLLDGGPFFITLNENKIYKIGDKIAQLVPYKNIDIDFEIVDNLDETTRNTGGFGSTGK